MESAVARGGCWQRPAVDVTGCWFAETEVWELVNIKRKTQNKGASFSNYKEIQLLPGYHTSLVGSLLFTTVASSRIIFCCLTRWPRKFFRRWGASARKCKLRSPLQGWGACGSWVPIPCGYDIAQSPYGLVSTPHVGSNTVYRQTNGFTSCDDVEKYGQYLLCVKGISCNKKTKILMTGLLLL